MVLICLFLAWIILPTKPEPVSIQPTDGLVDQVESIKNSLTVQDTPVVKQSLTTELISDEVKETAVRISEMRAKFDHIANADKMVEVKKEIVIFTRPNCPPCDRWKQIEQQKFERDGWKVAYCDQHNYGLTPTFLIETGGKQIERKGYLPFDKIGEVVK